MVQTGGLGSRQQEQDTVQCSTAQQNVCHVALTAMEVVRTSLEGCCSASARPVKMVVGGGGGQCGGGTGIILRVPVSPAPFLSQCAGASEGCSGVGPLWGGGCLVHRGDRDARHKAAARGPVAAGHVLSPQRPGPEWPQWPGATVEAGRH